MRNPFRTAAWLSLIAATSLACSDAPTAPASPTPEASPGLLDGLLKRSDEATVLKRTVPLAADDVVTKTIGPAGGLITLANAGLTLTIPPLALSVPTAITLLAPAGDLVGYHFEPHGLEFQLPVLALQDLTGTEAPRLGGLFGTGLKAVYFEGELAPLVEVLETIPVLPALGGSAGIFVLDHFSGYVIATN